MRLILLTLITMIAFAANSLLTRAAVAGQGMDPGMFAVIRTIAGAVVLLGILRFRARRADAESLSRRAIGAGTLALYMVGFSLAYRTLDAGIGALILFGGVQITMFAGAVVARDEVPTRRWIGAAVSFSGLALLVWPGGGAVVAPLSGAVMMGCAAVGWGLYSLLGRGAADPVAATARNFAGAVPLVLPLLAFGVRADGVGILLAVIAGAVTSGLGYALWYSVVPRLGATRAAVAQLSVPVLAGLGGAALLSEPPSLRFVVASVLVLGGIALSMVRRVA